MHTFDLYPVAITTTSNSVASLSPSNNIPFSVNLSMRLVSRTVFSCPKAGKKSSDKTARLHPGSYFGYSFSCRSGRPGSSFCSFCHVKCRTTSANGVSAWVTALKKLSRMSMHFVRCHERYAGIVESRKRCHPGTSWSFLGMTQAGERCATVRCDAILATSGTICAAVAPIMQRH